MPACRFTSPARQCLRAATVAALTLSATLAWSQTATASATAGAARAGTLKQVQGEVYLGKDAARRSPQPGDAVNAGERLSTGRDGAASMVLKDGTVLTLGPNATADLNQYQFDSTTQEGNLLVDLLQGSVRVVTGLLTKINPDRLKVRTPTAVVGVRGTDFIVEAVPEPEPIYSYVNRYWSDHSRLRR
jgi:hypothetical protein